MKDSVDIYNADQIDNLINHSDNKFVVEEDISTFNHTSDAWITKSKNRLKWTENSRIEKNIKLPQKNHSNIKKKILREIKEQISPTEVISDITHRGDMFENVVGVESNLYIQQNDINFIVYSTVIKQVIVLHNLANWVTFVFALNIENWEVK